MRLPVRSILLCLALLAATTGGAVLPSHQQHSAAAAADSATLSATFQTYGGTAREYLAVRGLMPGPTAPVAAKATRTSASLRAVEPKWIAARGPVTAPQAPGAPAPAPVTGSVAVQAVPVVVNTASRAHTGWAALDNAIDNIRTYYPGIAHWHAQDLGAWGETNMYTGDIYIAPRTPLADLLSVVEHEFMHALTGYMYGGMANAQVAADRLFSQSGEMGLEIEADCMARVDGATWTWYTPCTNQSWRATAAILLTEHKL